MKIEELILEKRETLIFGGLALIFLFVFHSYLGTEALGSFLSRMLVASTPILLATIGEIFAERSGVVNLGVEGIMAVGAVTGVMGAFLTKSPWLGAFFGALGGGLLSLILGLITITWKGMQVPTGLGLFIFGMGFSGVIGSPYVGKNLPYTFSKIKIPILSQIPILGQFLFNQDPFVYLSLILVPLAWFVLFKTKLGLKIRAVGENPSAADMSGVNVFKIRYLCVAIGGTLAGLGGSFMSLSYSPGWTSGMTAGRGWIAIALTIFALWDPLKALFGSWLFGATFSLQFILQRTGIPVNLLGMLPYLLPLLGLILVHIWKEKLGAPQALMKPYERED